MLLLDKGFSCQIVLKHHVQLYCFPRVPTCHDVHAVSFRALFYHFLARVEVRHHQEVHHHGGLLIVQAAQEVVLLDGFHDQICLAGYGRLEGSC